MLQCSVVYSRYQIFQVVTMLRDKILSNNNKSHAFTHFFSLARQKCVNFLFFFSTNSC